MTEKQVRDIVKSVIKSELSNIPDKSEIRKIAKEEAQKVSGDALTSKEVKEMIRQTLHAYHKWMWEKKGIWMNQI
jgi:hypothetical protein